MILLHGDCLKILPTIESESIDSLVTDPPAGISFMSKGWDSDKGGRTQWIDWLSSVLAECYRVMKPGAHGLIWALPRTSHWTMCAAEDSGLEIRDVITHLFGSGFPKSHNVQTATGSDDWQGWGTALKPAAEFWILCRKPLIGTVAANVLEYGTGGLNIDGCRVELATSDKKSEGGAIRSGAESNVRVYGGNPKKTQDNSTGRFPPNLILTHSADCTDQCADDCPVAEIGRQSGFQPPAGNTKVNRTKIAGSAAQLNSSQTRPTGPPIDSGGSAARYFPQFRYESKISSADRESGNKHPTVKSTQLMRWLCKLITPPGGMILDPFMGSGSTGKAAAEDGFQFTGIEQDPESFATAEKRLNKATAQGLLC